MEASEQADKTASESGSPTQKRLRPTVKSPTYGLVEGVKRGNIRIGMYYEIEKWFLSDMFHLDIPRQKPLPAPLTEAPASTRRFNRLMLDIIVRVSGTEHHLSDSTNVLGDIFLLV